MHSKSKLRKLFQVHVSDVNEKKINFAAQQSIAAGGFGDKQNLGAIKFDSGKKR